MLWIKIWNPLILNVKINITVLFDILRILNIYIEKEEDFICDFEKSMMIIEIRMTE